MCHISGLIVDRLPNTLRSTNGGSRPDLFCRDNVKVESNTFYDGFRQQLLDRPRQNVRSIFSDLERGAQEERIWRDSKKGDVYRHHG